MEIKVYKAVPEQLSHGEQYRYGETHQHDTARQPTYQEVNRIHEEKLRLAIHSYWSIHYFMFTLLCTPIKSSLDKASMESMVMS